MNIMDLGMILAAKCSIDIDPIVPAFSSAIVSFVKVFIPIVLIAYGMIDLAKAVMANDDKVMKEAQSKLIKRIIYAVVIFFVVAIVQFIFGILSTASSNSDSDNKIEKSDINSCINCFINNKNCKK